MTKPALPVGGKHWARELKLNSLTVLEVERDNFTGKAVPCSFRLPVCLSLRQQNKYGKKYDSGSLGTFHEKFKM